MKKSLRFNIQTINLSIYLTLLIPSILFFLYWITPFISIPLNLSCLYILYNYYKININCGEYLDISISHLAIMAILLFYTLYSCGIGQFSMAKDDILLRSNMIFSHLKYYHWPVFIQVENSDFTLLSYYLAYFIPISLISKIIPSINTYYLEFIWAFLTIYLGLLFFYSYCSKKLIFLIVFLPNGIYWIIDKYLFKDPVPLKFFSSLMTLAHGPQQLISTILGLCIILSEIAKKQKSIFTINIIVLVFFWSPFISIALALIIIPQYKTIKIVCKENIISLVTLLIFIVFYAEKETNFFAHIKPLSEINYSYFLFYCTDLILITFLFKKYSRNQINYYHVYILIILIILPFIHFGKHNDFMTKVSTPLIFMHYLILIQEIKLQNIKYNVGIFILLSIYSLSSIYQLLNPIITKPSNIDYITLYKDKTMIDLYKDKDIHAQFYSNKSSVFCKYFLK